MTEPTMRQDSPQTSHHNQPFGAQINQSNTLSTPVFVVLILALFIAALVSSTAIVLALSAKDAAVIAEREARLAQNRYDTLNVDVKVMRTLLQQSGLELPEEAQR